MIKKDFLKKLFPLAVVALIAAYTSIGYAAQNKAASFKAIEAKVPMTVSLSYSEASKGETSLEKLTEGKKAILIDFWASWCGPCKQLMPNFVKEASFYEKQGICPVGINLDDGKSGVLKAEEFKKKHNISFPWLVGGGFNNEYAKLFEVNTIPRTVLISAEGEVLFNGHPQDSKLKEILATLNSKKNILASVEKK